MDKTTQDSLAKKPVDMRDRILEHLEALTSAVSLDDLARLSTSDIAETLIISEPGEPVPQRPCSRRSCG